MVIAVFIAVFATQIGISIIAVLATRSARAAARHADQATAEAALAAREAYRARMDLKRVANALAEMERARSHPRRMLPVVPAVLPAFRERDVTVAGGEPGEAPEGPSEPERPKVHVESAGVAGQAVRNLLVSAGVPVFDFTAEAAEAAAGAITPFPLMVDGRASLVQLAGACGMYPGGLPVGYGTVEQIITQFYEGRG